MTTAAGAPPPLTTDWHGGDDRPPPRREPRSIAHLTEVAVVELLAAAYDRLTLVEQERRDHLWDAIHHLEALRDRFATADLRRTIATLEGYPDRRAE